MSIKGRKRGFRSKLSFRNCYMNNSKNNLCNAPVKKGESLCSTCKEIDELDLIDLSIFDSFARKVVESRV
jgi:hypothetical protein